MTKGKKVIRTIDEIIIKPADKVSAIVIKDKTADIQEVCRQLSDTPFYEKVHEDPTGEVMHRVNLHVHNILEKGQIIKNNSKYFTTDIDRTQLFLMFTKFYKGLDDLLGRPIVSETGGPTEKNSQFVAHFINPLVPLTISFIRYAIQWLRSQRISGIYPLIQGYDH